jgi:hypothetical protein
MVHGVYLLELPEHGLQLTIVASNDFAELVEQS